MVIAYFYETGLRINLDKSEILPVGRVENLETLALEAGCKVGRLPSSYLGIPLGANHKSVAVWDFLWGGGALERKPHLVNWDTVCLDKRKGGLGVRRLSTLNRAFLCKWNWRFANERENFWRHVISRKFGEEEGGWVSREVRESYGVGFWKEIRKEGAWVEEFWDSSGEEGVWSPRFSRPFNDWEVEEVERLLLTIQGVRLIPLVEDRMLWKVTSNGIFSVKSLYNDLSSRRAGLFPHGLIWSPSLPSKVSFFAWEASWGNVLTMDQLKKRGWALANRCFLCCEEEESIDHILIHCSRARVLWELLFAIFGVFWVLPFSIRDTLIEWRGFMLGKKRRKVWKAAPLCLFWAVWMERNRIAFDNEDFSVHRLKILLFVIFGRGQSQL
ncbi:putative ribonuclease H protein [Vitis vinifera]|uniref:Putative ribonuclease H protein n=1 Tax=Vitis vinifera TaxID=29760 RepID=A0A438K7E2_VITVI|nr:putative ribonuclease H protein [Vitis vinifera]